MGDACLLYSSTVDGRMLVVMRKNDEVRYQWDIDPLHILSASGEQPVTQTRGLRVLPDGSVVVMLFLAASSTFGTRGSTSAATNSAGESSKKVRTTCRSTPARTSCRLATAR